MTSLALDPRTMNNSQFVANIVRDSYDIEFPELREWNSRPCQRHGELTAGCGRCGVWPRRHQRVGITWLYLTPRAGLFDSTGLGKAQPLDARVLTPSGWRLMGSLRPGDAVTDPDGAESFVEAVYPRGEMDVYRVEFSDGTSCESTLDHLWKVRGPGENRFRVVRLRDVRDGLESGSHAGRPAVPLVRRPAEFAEAAELPLDPYLVGLLLGDGGLARTTPVFTTADEELVRAVALALPDGVRPVPAGRYDYRLSAGGRSFSGVNPLTAALRSLGMLGLRSYEKHVPLPYLYGSVKTRLAVLQGLMDTDGTASPASGAEFSSASRQLAADVAELARSLGMSVHEHDGSEVTYSYRGEIRTGRRRWRVHIRPGNNCRTGVLLFRLARKASVPLPSARHDGVKWIRSVTYSRTVPVQCIAVSSPSHLYVTDGWTVTHNTVQVAGLLAMLLENGELGMFSQHSRKGLIIARAATIGQWQAELARMVPGLATVAVTGSARERGAKLSGEWEVALIGPEMLASKVTRGADQLSHFDFGTVICDDIECLKNVNKTSRTIRNLIDPAGREHADRVVIATATPLDKRLTQLYDLGTILGWQSVLGSRKEFAHRYVRTEKVWYTPRLKPVRCRWCKTVMIADHKNRIWVDVKLKTAGPCPSRPGEGHFPLSRAVPGARFDEVEKGVNAERIGEFRDLIAPLALRRTAAECDDVAMPEVVPGQVWLELGPEQAKRYEEIRRGAAAAGTVSRKEAENWWLRAWQVTSSLACLDSSRSGESVKLDWVTEALSGDLGAEPVVVYCYFRPTLADLGARLDSLGIANVRIWGEQHAAEQGTALAAFNSGRVNVMLITDAGGMGLNLQRARRLIMVDTPRSAGRVQQIVGRIKRDASEHQAVYVTQLLTVTPMERALHEMIGSEAIMAATVLDGGQMSEYAWADQPGRIMEAITG